jgi:type II secretory pathway component PulK
VALILVLWLVVILGAIGATVVGAARTSSVLATNVRAGVVSRYAAESGIEATVSAIERELAARPDSMARAAFLNALEDVARDSIVLGEGRAAVAISDPTARLDVNAAPATGLAALLAQFTDVGRASETARAVRAWIERSPDAADRGGLAPGGASPFVTPVRSLEELRSIPGVDVPALERAAPYLTVDGDGTVNVRSASDTVLASATGEQRGEPSRLVLIARGWQRGHPLTHEIQAIYAVSGSSLVLVHWRERDL